jgi:hypothetical protein
MGRKSGMSGPLRSRRGHSATAALAALVFGLTAGMAVLRASAKHDEDSMTKIRIVVTAGDENRPVGNASVYVRVPEGHKGKLQELDLKTNEDGSVKVPELPKGKILVQVVAPGWRTFGKWYDVEKDEEEIKIHLKEPPRWY